DLVERAHHRLALGGRLIEHNSESAEDDFYRLAPGARGGLAVLLDHPFEPLERWHARRVPALPVLRRAVERVLAEAGDVDRRVRLLHGVRAGEGFRNVIMATIESERVLRPERDQRLEEFVG